MNKTTTETNLPNIEADKLWTGVIPIVRAEKTVTASATPKFAGVIPITIDIEPIEVKNKHLMNETSIPKTWN